jgi:hypothetical protein
MYEVLSKPRGITYQYNIINTFKKYDDAYYFIANLLWEANENYNWSSSCKYLHDGYNPKKIFCYGSTFIYKNKVCYKIKLNLKNKKNGN